MAKAKPKDNSESPFVDVTEAAGILGLSTNTVYSYIRQGIIPAKRIGRTIRISRAWLLRQDNTDVAKREAELLAEYDQIFGGDDKE